MKNGLHYLLTIGCCALLAGVAAAQSGEWETLYQDASTLYQQGKYDQAVVVAKKMLEVAQRESPENPTVADSLNALAVLYEEQGQFAAAERSYVRSLAIREKVLGPDHPDVATSLNNLALLYKKQGRYEEAEPLYMRSLAICEKALGPEHPNVASSLQNIAALYAKMGKTDEAKALSDRAAKIRELKR